MKLMRCIPWRLSRAEHNRGSGGPEQHMNSTNGATRLKSCFDKTSNDSDANPLLMQMGCVYLEIYSADN